MRHRLGKMLRWKQQRQTTVGPLADQPEHAWRHGANVDGDVARGSTGAQIGLGRPLLKVGTRRVMALAAPQPTQRRDFSATAVTGRSGLMPTQLRTSSAPVEISNSW